MIVHTQRGADPDRPGRAGRLAELAAAAAGCTRCPQLVASRTRVVFGDGDPDAELMLIGEAPGAREDETGEPFTGASGRVLDELLAGIGLTRERVYVTSVLKCRPPGNRDPAPAEIERCRPYLHEQLALVRPRVVCTLGNFATQLLRGEPTGIRALHGRPERMERGDLAVHLVPLYHPAAALYARTLLDALREDFARIPALLAAPLPPPARDAPADPAAGEAPAAAAPPGDKAGEEPPQLGLF